ncbi:MAG: KaiC 1, partial [Chitinophagaceae bacterium]
DKGIDLIDVYLSSDGVLTGSAREQQQLHEAAGIELRTHAMTRKDREIERKKLILAAKIDSLNQEFESIQDELNKTYLEEDLRKEILERNRAQLAKQRTNKSSDGKSKKGS